MNTRAITLIATIAVIGIVAVGAGYAYTAMTVNDNNYAEAKYVTLTQQDYTFNSAASDYFDSISAKYGDPAAEHIGYKISTGNGNGIVNATVINDANDMLGAENSSSKTYVLVQLGTATINATAHGYTAGSQPDFDLKIDSTSGFTAGTLLTYYLLDGTKIVGKVVGSAWKAADGISDVSIEFTATPSALTYGAKTLKLCYGYTTDSETTGGTSIDGYVEEIPKDLSSGKIVFKAIITA